MEAKHLFLPFTVMTLIVLMVLPVSGQAGYYGNGMSDLYATCDHCYPVKKLHQHKTVSHHKRSHGSSFSPITKTYPPACVRANCGGRWVWVPASRSRDDVTFDWGATRYSGSNYVEDDMGTDDDMRTGDDDVGDNPDMNNQY